jgi:uroporphyrin-III C-methyltransferase
MTKKGCLVVVGTGFRAGGQITYESVSAIEHADKVFYGEANSLIVDQILSLNPRSETLTDLYAKGKSRMVTYTQMTQRMVAAVREGLDVCVVLYGHPGVFAKPAHDAIRELRADGYEAQMLPGVSAEDCLFADLGIDPGHYGCQSYEATDFLLRRRIVDRRSTLVLWQVGAIGILDMPDHKETRRVGPEMLVEALLELYPAEHETIVYEASQYAIFTPRMERVPIRGLADVELTMASTLAILPDPSWNRSSTDIERAKRLGVEEYVRNPDFLLEPRP